MSIHCVMKQVDNSHGYLFQCVLRAREEIVAQLAARHDPKQFVASYIEDHSAPELGEERRF